MFATPAILSLLFFVYIRPQELIPGLERVPLLYLLVALALVALALDVRLGYVRIQNNPLLPWALAHIAWCLLSMAVFGPPRPDRARHGAQRGLHPVHGAVAGGTDASAP